MKTVRKHVTYLRNLLSCEQDFGDVIMNGLGLVKSKAWQNMVLHSCSH